MRRLLFLSGLLYISTTHAQAQSQPFSIGEVQQLRSEVLSETRTLNIYLPEGYEKNTTQTYPVIYLLDGSANEDFVHVAGVVQFLTMIQQMPPSIIVGIANVDRKRDFTFPTTVEADKKAYPTTGQSEKFIRFMEQELQPFVQQHFRANSVRTIVGQSLGGLLASEILITRPRLFNRYVIVSPSLWWDNESLLAKIKYSKPVDAQVFIAVGTEGKQMEHDAKLLSEKLTNPVVTGMAVRFVPMPAENHLTILHHAVYMGLQVLNAKKEQE